MSIDRQEAASALTDIESVVRRLRQSRTYNFSSLMLIMWGALVFAGYTFSTRLLAASVLFIVFGCILSIGVGHLRQRQMDAFWPIYFMMAYTIIGLWFGYAFVAIGAGITALTLIGYFFAGDWFYLWMAAVDGGGLVLGGLWMRRS
jgi:hypothetical protein